MLRAGLHETLVRRGLTMKALDQTLGGAPFGLYVHHSVEGLVYANDALMATWGLDWTGVKGFGWLNVVEPDDREALLAALRDFEHHRVSMDVRYRIRTPSGPRTVVASLQAVNDSFGQRAATLGVVRDVTMEERRRPSVLTEQRNQAIASLNAEIQHEVNNALQAVLTTERVLRETPQSTDHTPLLDELRLTVQRTVGLLKALHAPSTTHRTCVDDALRQRLPLYRELLDDIDLEVSFGAAVDVALPEAQVDQVVLHLLLTARQKLRGRGVVLLNTSCTEEAAIVTFELRSEESDGSNTRRRSRSAEQLGHHATLQLLQNIGGGLSIRDNLLEIRLPVVEPLPRPEKPEPLHILLVDDHVALRQAVAHTLALLGHHVRTAASVGEALELFSLDTPIDVVVTDLVLADGDGSEVALAAVRRAHPSTVVLMSGYGRHDVTMRHALDQATPFLQKPFTASNLLEVIATARA